MLLKAVEGEGARNLKELLVLQHHRCWVFAQTNPMHVHQQRLGLLLLLGCCRAGSLCTQTAIQPSPLCSKWDGFALILLKNAYAYTDSHIQDKCSCLLSLLLFYFYLFIQATQSSWPLHYFPARQKNSAHLKTQLVFFSRIKECMID